jgi:hypothetical protein
MPNHNFGVCIYDKGQTSVSCLLSCTRDGNLVVFCQVRCALWSLDSTYG